MKGVIINKEQMNLILNNFDYTHFNVRSVTGPTKQISPVRKNAFIESSKYFDNKKNVINLNNTNYKKKFFEKYAMNEVGIVMPFFEQISSSEYKYNGMYKFLNYDEIESIVEVMHVHDLIF